MTDSTQSIPLAPLRNGSRGDSVTTDDAGSAAYAVRQRKASRREEWAEQTKLAEMLRRHVNPEYTFWTSLENKPRSAISGMLARRRGVRAGLGDVLVISRRKSGRVVVLFLEIKSPRAAGLSKAQKLIAAEVKKAGAGYFLVRSARAALAALFRSGVVFRRKYKPPQRLEPHEGPFSDLTRPFPLSADVAAERAAARRRYRARQRARRAAAATAMQSPA